MPNPAISPNPTPAGAKKIRSFIGPAIIALLILFILRRSLFSGGSIVAGLPNTDLHLQFLGWRYFAFTQWLHGHFPFWDPHVFCGIPFFAQMQSNLLYPITWIHFFTSTAVGCNIEVAANVYIAALCTYFWARQRQINRMGSVLSATAFAFSGPVYLRVMAGHLSPLASVAWAPLVFVAIDKILAERFLAGILIGSAGVALQFLGGYPQYAYYGLLVGAIYLILQSIGRRRIIRMYAAFAAIYILGGLLAAVQIIPAALAAGESIRAGGTSYVFSSMLSLPPESLLSIFIPYPFGDIANIQYVGRWYLWEMSAYCGLCVFVLACIGLAAMERKDKWRMLLLLIAILILTLGSYTPVHRVLYEIIPGFKTFRGASKFGAFWVLILAILAGHGWEKIYQGKIPRKTILFTAIGAGISAVLAAIVYQFNTPNGPIGELIRLVFRSGQVYTNERVFRQPDLLESMTQWVGRQWCIAAALLGIMCVLIYWRRYSFTPAYLLLLLAIAEVFAAAGDSNATSPLATPYPAQWTQAVANATNHDQRILYGNSLAYGNDGNLIGCDSLWGYDPGQPKRYTELIAASQDQHPASADQYGFEFLRVSRVFQLLRCRYILQWNGKQSVLEIRDPMPRLSLIGNEVRMTDPAQIADQLVKKFDFRHSVILESDLMRPVGPAPTPAGAAGHVTILHDSINDLEIQADLPAPAILLITDSYAPGWHARPIEPNDNQSHYEVLRADAVLRAIPLAAGHHHFDLYYIAPGLWTGVALSALALIAWLIGIIRSLQLN